MYTDEEKHEFETKPGSLLSWRKNAESNVNNIFPMFLGGSKLQQSTKKAVTHQMQKKLLDPKLQRDLIPEWDFGCRRMTPGVGYLEALQEDNVEVVIGPIDKITESGCVAGGKEHQLDVLICATGFDVSFRPRFPIIGNKEENLQDLWQQNAHSYLGLAAPKQPNYLHFLGPNCPIGSGPLVGAIGKHSIRDTARVTSTNSKQRLRRTTSSTGATAGRPKRSIPSHQETTPSQTSQPEQTSSCETPSGHPAVGAGTSRIPSTAASQPSGQAPQCTTSRPSATQGLRTGK